VAAKLGEDQSLRVRRESGSLGELRVAVDGTDVFDAGFLGYPAPSSVTKTVQQFLRGEKP
jgi:hypothetical protein